MTDGMRGKGPLELKGASTQTRLDRQALTDLWPPPSLWLPRPQFSDLVWVQVRIGFQPDSLPPSVPGDTTTTTLRQ